MPKNKETSPKNMRRLSRDLFSDAEIYQEVAQRAYESQTEGDKDDATWRRNMLVKLTEEAVCCIEAAEKKGRKCPELKEALKHAQTSLKGPHSDSTTATSVDRDNVDAAMPQDDTESLVTRSYCSGSSNNQNKSSLDSDEDANPHHDSTPPLICSPPTNERSTNQLKPKPTKSDRGQTAGGSEFIDRRLPTKDHVNFGPELSTSSHQPTQQSGEQTTQLPTQPSQKSQNRPLEKLTTRSTTQSTTGSTKRPPSQSTSKSAIKTAQPIKKSTTQLTTQPPIKIKQKPPIDKQPKSAPIHKNPPSSFVSGHRSTTRNEPNPPPSHSKVNSAITKSCYTEPSTHSTRANESCYTAPSTHSTRITESQYAATSTHSTRLSKNTNRSTAVSTKHSSKRFTKPLSNISDASNAASELRQNREEAEREREEIRSQQEELERIMREESQQHEQAAREEAERIARQARETAERIARETNENLQEAIRISTRQAREKVRDVNRREQEKHSDILDRMSNSSGGSRTFYTTKTREDSGTEVYGVAASNRLIAPSNRTEDESPNRHRSVSEVSGYTVRASTCHTVAQTATSTRNGQESHQQKTNRRPKETRKQRDTHSQAQSQPNKERRQTTIPATSNQPSNHSIVTGVRETPQAVEIRAVAEETTRATLAAAGINKTPNGRSSLEALKIAERRRPSIAFDGINKSIDFDEHMKNFLSAVDMPDLSTKDRLKEFQHWFKSLALARINCYMRRTDTDAAFEEAVERLKAEYGNRKQSAEDMLQSTLEGNVIKKHQFEEMSEFIFKVEGTYTLACETNKEGDFDRESVYKRILNKKLPHLKEKWSWYACRLPDDYPTFRQFLDFLLLNIRASTLLHEYDDDQGAEEKQKASDVAVINSTMAPQTTWQLPVPYDPSIPPPLPPQFYCTTPPPCLPTAYNQ